jgi:hypothetical protein
MSLEIGSIIPKIAQGIQEIVQDKEKQKRLFLLECRHNLGVLGMTEWENVHQDMIFELINHLKTEITQNLLVHFENDVFHLGAQAIREIFNDNKDEITPSNNDVFMQIILKINMLKIIASLPHELRIYHHANLSIRIGNLRKSLLLIINTIEK